MLINLSHSWHHDFFLQWCEDRANIDGFFYFFIKNVFLLIPILLIDMLRCKEDEL